MMPREETRPGHHPWKEPTLRMNPRLYPAMLGLVLVALPILVWLFANWTTIGSVVLIFPWSDDAGIHTGDVMLCSVLTPLWVGTAWRLMRLLRSTSSR